MPDNNSPPPRNFSLAHGDSRQELPAAPGMPPGMPPGTQEPGKPFHWQAEPVPAGGLQPKPGAPVSLPSLADDVIGPFPV